ncbi:MAG: DUF2461 domain-containing protein [candidate division Zixibacteria bacterium]
MKSKHNKLEFNGFHKDTISFLKNNRKKNDKKWFEENRMKYEEYVLTPFRNLVSGLSGTMLEIDPKIETSPNINKTITKMYRDTRFSKDKSLFKKNMWLVFKRNGKQWQDYPGFFFEIMSDDNMYRYGMGFYRASRDTMDRFRDQLEANPGAFKKVIAPFVRGKAFDLAGEEYKRSLSGDIPDWLQEWYQKKSFYLVQYRHPDSLLLSSRLAKYLNEQFLLLKPLYKFLQNIIDR